MYHIGVKVCIFPTFCYSGTILLIKLSFPHLIALVFLLKWKDGVSVALFLVLGCLLCINFSWV